MSRHHSLLFELLAHRTRWTDDYLTKPLRKPDLLAIINKIVLQRRAGKSSLPFSPDCYESLRKGLVRSLCKPKFESISQERSSRPLKKSPFLMQALTSPLLVVLSYSLAHVYTHISYCLLKLTVVFLKFLSLSRFALPWVHFLLSFSQ